MKIFRILIPGLLLLMLTGFMPYAPAEKQEKPRNVILLIGDGMGLSQLSSAFYYGSGHPNFSRFPVVGFITTSSCSDKITDSAAGATAFSTGKKTKNNRVGLSPKGKKPENLISHFSKKEKSSGLVVTSSITHATPAAFYAYQGSRFQENSIARQLGSSPLNFFAGGGSRYFDFSDREELEALGFNLFTDSLRAFSSVKNSTRLGFLLDDGSMPGKPEGRGDYLPKATKLAMEFLSQNKAGFFLMVEGSQIDFAGHSNNGIMIIEEVRDFDEAVGAALDFADKDGHTLVIVTADHETGGFTLAAEEKLQANGRTKTDYNSLQPRFSTGMHTAALVPVLASGPGSEQFHGIYPNTDLHKKIKEVLE